MKSNNVVKVSFNGERIGYIFENPTIAQKLYVKAFNIGLVAVR